MKARLVLLAGAFLVNLGAAPVTTSSPTGSFSTVSPDWFRPAPAAPPSATAPVTPPDDPAPSPTDTDQASTAPEVSDTSTAAAPVVVRHYSMDDLASSIHSLSADYSDGTHYSIDDLAQQMGGR